MYLIFLAPTYINILAIYSISNVHDVNWGSRLRIQDEDTADNFERTEQRRQIRYRNCGSNFLGIYLVANIVIARIIIDFNRASDGASDSNSYYNT